MTFLFIHSLTPTNSLLHLLHCILPYQQPRLPRSRACPHSRPIIAHTPCDPSNRRRCSGGTSFVRASAICRPVLQKKICSEWSRTSRYLRAKCTVFFVRSTDLAAASAEAESMNKLRLLGMLPAPSPRELKKFKNPRLRTYFSPSAAATHSASVVLSALTVCFDDFQAIGTDL